MKKLAALTVMLLLSVASLSACTPHEHVVGKWYTSEDGHTPDFVCTWDRCDICFEPEEPHVDENGDGVCDVCSYEKKVD